MKTLSPLAAAIAVVLASSSMSTLAANTFEVKNQTANGTPSYVVGQLGQTTSEDTVASLKRLLNNQSVYATNGNEGFAVTQQWTDELGKQHTRVSQTINGLNVYGTAMVVHADVVQNDSALVVNDSANIYAVSGSLALNDQPVQNLSLLQSKAKGNEHAVSLGKELGEVTDSPELAYVYLPLSGDTKLAWKMEVTWHNSNTDFGRDVVFFDAYNNDLLTRHAQVHSAKNWKTYTLNGGSAQNAPGTLLCTNDQSCGGNAAAQRAHDGSSKVYDYYKSKFNRDSLDNRGMTLISSVDMGEANAYWTGSQMIYGSAMNGMNDFTSDFDVIGHELTHGVTQHTANLVYANASGALNEAWSDIMGVTAESYKNGTISSTWLLGDGLYNTPGKAFRYMSNPTKDNYSKDWWPERIPYASNPNGQNDQGGVHGNSGIANLAYTLLVDGGTHPRGKSSAVVPNLGMAKAEQIFYRALSTYMTSSTNFAGARTATAQAAQDLYGATEKAAVEKAWCAVGVGSCGTPPPPPPSGSLNNNVPVSVPSVSKDQDVVYTMNVPTGSTAINFTASGGSGDADLYVKFGSAPTDSSYDCRPYLDGNNESCTGTQSGGTYHVRLKAYSAFSGVSLTGSYVANGDGDGDGDGGNCTATAWDASTVYLNGDRASAGGKVYEARWWTQNESPTAGQDEWYVWHVPAACK